MTHLWGTACATAGGTVAIFLYNNLNIFHYIIITIGTLITLIMANAYFVRRNEIIKILKSMEVKDGYKVTH